MFVSTQGLTKTYGSFTALSGCDLNVPRGEICGLLGPNGSGKTTLLRMLMGFLQPSGGKATIDALDCWRESVRLHQRVAYLPGEVRLFRRMRGHDVLRFFARVRPDGNLRAAQQIAERLGLDLRRQVARSSTGMRQMLALSSVLSLNVPLLILDEPTSNLDPTVRSTVLELIHESKAAGRTVLFSSHVLSEVEEVCDRVVILRQGQLVHDQVMDEVRREHRIRARLSEPLPDVPHDVADHVAHVEQRDGTVTISAPDELAPLLGWLATLPISEVRIEPVGLRAVYDRFHAERG